MQYHQQALNSSIFYLRCYYEYISTILLDTTQTLSSKSVAIDGENAQYIEALRQNIYDSFDNITGIIGMVELVELFPCQQVSYEQLEDGKECLAFEDITVDFVSILK